MRTIDNYDGINLNYLRDLIHAESTSAGWYTKIDAVKQILNDTDPELGEYFEGWRDLGYLALIHSEVSEAVEGIRKGLPDDHLKHRLAVEVELADALIRILDICGRKGYDIGGAVVEKVKYNKQRSDHKLENREKVGGKKY